MDIGTMDAATYEAWIKVNAEMTEANTRRRERRQRNPIQREPSAAAARPPNPLAAARPSDWLAPTAAKTSRPKATPTPAQERPPVKVAWAEFGRQFSQAWGCVYWLLEGIAVLLFKMLSVAASVWQSSREHAGVYGRSSWELAAQAMNMMIQYKLAGPASVLGLAGLVGPQLVRLLSMDHLIPGALWSWGTSTNTQHHNPLHQPPPVVPPPGGASNKAGSGGGDYVVITQTLPTLSPPFSRLLGGLGMGDAGVEAVADLDRLVRQLGQQMADTEADMRGLVANVAKFPSQPLSLVYTPTEWVWSWLAGRNPVSTRAAAVRTIARSAAAERQSTASQVQQMFESRFGAAMDECSLSLPHGQPAQRGNPTQGTSRQLRDYENQVKEEEAKAGVLWQSLQVLTGVSPLSPEVQAELEQRKTAIMDGDRGARVSESGTTISCKALASVERVVALAVAGGRQDQEGLERLAKRALDVANQAGRVAWSGANQGTIERWDGLIIQHLKVYLDEMKDTYRQRDRAWEPMVAACHGPVC
ncbi:hypothetical protein QBC39DRAFT_358834 [Podospora conica]|nr:hypothetical protein QBC39DRAFT_358834 [Schizothecium conicum]